MARGALVVVLLATLLAGLVLVPGRAGADVGDAPCAPPPIWAVTGGSAASGNVADLLQYAPDGSVLSTVELVDASGQPLANPIGDIAWSADGGTLYTVPFGVWLGDEQPYLRSYDPTTGRQTGEVTLTGIDPSLTARMNALTASADGQLYLGIYDDPHIFKVDPATGAVTEFAQFPDGVGSSGDFLTLPDGTIIGFGDDAGGADVSHVYRISPDGSTVTWVGDVPRSFGAAQSGGALYLTGHYGSQLLKLAIADIPTTVATNPDLPVTVVTDAPAGEVLNGATSVDDEEGCGASYVVSKTADPSSQAAPGQEVTYTIVIRNTSSVPYTAAAPASLSDDMGNVLDDAAYVTGSASATAGTFTISNGVLTWEGPLAAQGQPGDTVTITYRVRIDDAPQGDGVLVNRVDATGFGGSCDPTATCSTNVVIVPPESSFAVTKSADVPVVSPGGVITYTVKVTNTSTTAGTVVVDDVITADMGVSVEDISLDHGSVAWSGLNLTWTIPSLASGATATMTYKVRVADTGTGTVHNRARIGTDDPCQAPTCAEVDVDVIADPGVPMASLPIALGAVLVIGGAVILRRRRVTVHG